MKEEPPTEQLLDELRASSDLETFIDQRVAGCPALPDELAKLLEQKGRKRSEVIKDAGLNSTYGYQIFVGQRNPSRNKVLQIAFALHCDLRETNRLLKCSDHSPLYPKSRRDAIIIYSIDQGSSLMKTNAKLFQFSEDTID